MRTIIVAPTQAVALHTADAYDVAPHARTTILASTPTRLRGLRITPEDRVIWASYRGGWRDMAAMLATVALCRLSGGSYV